MEPLSSKPGPSAIPSRTPESPHISAKSKDKVERSPSSQQLESVSLSQTGQEIKPYLEAMADLPDVRQKRIREIEAALEKGTYSVSSQDLADKLIQDLSTQQPGASSSSS